ncbi:PAS domain-containing sensor histidine kinase [Fibrella sp. HMF5335]|uniref:histidine kinase n=1 Tax=Fibrella rubiginis TaxID=2817060 RepID=A0A939GF07_9BACT|nr:PAS domain-containing sensor histidine kinase [Fibrella rubiginis]MBO0936014.1 PAS domain-containing sensor histidine kinase [Fibrella rubiginis]
MPSYPTELSDDAAPANRLRQQEEAIHDLTQQLSERTAEVGMLRMLLADEAQHQSQETHLLRIFRYTSVAIGILKGPEFVVELANPAMCALWARPEAELLGRPIFSVLPEAAKQGFEELLAQVMQTGIPFIGTEMPVVLQREGNLGTVYFDLVYEPFPDADGRINRVIVTATDVTSRLKTRDQSDKLLAQERELHELKSNFVTMASHEFRTPMGTILSSASLIGRYNGADDGEKRERHVQRIKAAVHGLTDLLNDFLSLGQMEQETMHGQPQPLELQTFCAEILDDMQGMVKIGQHFVYQHLAGALTVSIDGSMLRNILVNLLVNASKYSSEGKSIELTTAVQDNLLVVTVRDEGIGIPDADKDKLFINFFRARNAIHVQGTGLGLYIVKRYVDLLGGTISFTSQLDSGTIFTVQLPIYPFVA